MNCGKILISIQYSAFIFGWKASYASLVVLIITFPDYKSNIFLLIAKIDFYLY